jgi:CBS domain-containing protein
MKVREPMTPNAICCLRTDTAESVAKRMLQRDVGSLPVVTDRDSRASWNNDRPGFVLLHCGARTRSEDHSHREVRSTEPNHVSRGVELGDMRARDAATGAFR